MLVEEAMKASALVAGIFLLSGCVSLTDKQKEAREYRDEENRAAYFAYRQHCKRNGGIVVINGTHGRLASYGIPHPGNYRCLKSMSFR
jgi:hypothetical protein